MHHPQKPTPNFLSPKSLARRLEVSVKTVSRWRASGALRAHQLGGQLRYSEEDVAAFLAQRRG